jgi:hypothetical protein
MIRAIKMTFFLIVATTVFTFIIFELVNVINWLFTNKWYDLNHFIKSSSGQIFLAVVISPIIAAYDCYLNYKSNKL